MTGMTTVISNIYYYPVVDRHAILIYPLHKVLKPFIVHNPPHLSRSSSISDSSFDFTSIFSL